MPGFLFTTVAIVFNINLSTSQNLNSISLLIGSNEFETFNPVPVTDNQADIRLFTYNDDVTLQYDRTVILRFTPAISNFIDAVEAAGQFIRDTATVNIIDNDSK